MRTKNDFSWDGIYQIRPRAHMFVYLCLRACVCLFVCMSVFKLSLAKSRHEDIRKRIYRWAYGIKIEWGSKFRLQGHLRIALLDVYMEVH